MDELTQMREQLASMKRSLDESKIINRDLMIYVMKQKSSWMNNLVKWELILLPVILLLLLFECYIAGISMWFFIVGMAGVIVDTFLDLKTVRISRRSIETLDLLSLRRKIVKQKRQRYLQTIIVMPLCLIWLGWFSWSMAGGMFREAIPDPRVFFWFALGFVGVIFALTVGVCVWVYKKMQTTSNELLSDIDQLEAES